MKFTQLRLAGFKSFVDPTEMRIEPGLTGVIGPNGCGKSNLLEALRWVMGATSAKSLRGGGMEDVIFAGTDARPARNHAEVVLTIDNADRRAPARFNDTETLEISRRIGRGAGSTYKINGEDVRAKDVQLLFADAGTGANSPALVRQGQISELIAAKPENRRRVLEEAAGVSGLRARRHEAELRLKAAEGNLDRLQEVIDETAARHSMLQKQARQAQRYRKLSASIRALEAAVWLNRWREASAAAEAAETSVTTCREAADTAIRTAAEARTKADVEAAGREPARQAEAEASAALRRLERERDRIERDAADVSRAIHDLETRLRELETAAEREQSIIEDARENSERTEGELEAIDKLIAREKDALAGAEAAAVDADKRRQDKEAVLDDRARDLAEKQAALETARRDAERLESRLAQLGHEILTARTELDSLRNSPALGKLDAAEAAAKAADATRDQAQAEFEKAETGCRAAEGSHEETRNKHRSATADRDALRREAEAIEKVLASTTHAIEDPALDAVRARPGYEHALAAALGDDLDASLNPDAVRAWHVSGCKAEPLPGGCVPLSDHVDAPAALRGRLDAVGVISAEKAEKAVNQLKPGQRLVTREGDVWRWDGLVARADAPCAAVARLEQKNRLEAIATELVERDAACEAIEQDLKSAEDALAKARKTESDARQAIPPAELAAREALSEVSRLREAAASEAARATSLEERLTRLNAERSENDDALKAARALLSGPDRSAENDEAIEAAREEAETARRVAADTRASLESVRRESELRRQRRAAMQRDHDAWRERCTKAADRIQHIVSQTDVSVKALEEARARPAVLEEQLHTLTDQIETAEKTANEARAASVEREDVVKLADREARTAETAASQARETRAAAEAKLTAARERLQETTERLQDATGAAPGTLAKRLEDEDLEGLSADALEQRLDQSRQSRERLGAVNLRADQEAEELANKQAEMTHERDDLLGAIDRLRKAVDQLSREGRTRLLEAFEVVDGHFRSLFATLFEGGHAELRLTEHEDPLEAGLEIFACPPGKKLETMSLMSGGEQALTASALIFAVFLSNPAPVCVLDEVDAPLDDLNVDRYCRMLDEMRRLTETRFLVITHNPLTMSRVDRLFGVTMAERGVSQLVSVDLVGAEQLVAAE